MKRRPDPRTRLDYAGCALEARCDEDADLAWLLDFLCPWFEPAPEAEPPAAREADPPAARVALRRDAAAFAAAREAGPEPGTAPQPAFLADGAALALSAWAGGGSARRWYDASADAFLESPAQGEWRVLAAPGAHFARVAWMRVLRELATHGAAARGARLLHAAALEARGEAIAFVGPKRSGKTSSLLFALGAPGARFVANDRLCAFGDAPARVRGMPTIVNLRAETLAAFPALAARVRAQDPRVASRPGESRAGQPEWPRRPGSAGLGSADFLAAAGVAACAQAPLALLVFPSVSRSPGRFACARLPAEEVARRLREADLLSGAPQAGPFGAQTAPRAPTGAPDDALSRLAARVPGVACRLDLDAFAGDPSAFLEALRRAAA